MPPFTVSRALSAGGRAVALTFDDGPDPRFTPLVLDELARLDAPATFFVTGRQAERYPGLVRRIVEEGHHLGSHSSTHAEPGALGWGVIRDFRAGRRAVERAAGGPVSLFRPPKGYLGRHERVAMRALRLEPWLWTIDPEDWRPGASPTDVLGRLTRLSAGDVILLHDCIQGPLAPPAVDRSTTVAVLPELVRRVRDQGLELVSLPGPQTCMRGHGWPPPGWMRFRPGRRRERQRAGGNEPRVGGPRRISCQ